MILLVTIPLLVAAAEAPPPVEPCGDAPSGMACIPGGWSIRGDDGDEHHCQQRFGKALRAHPNARPAARVWVQTFYMDLTEVTYEAYAACIEAGACKRRKEDGRWGPSYGDFNRPRQPISGASWYDAVDYCRWRGGHLPTEAQWEKAARGPDGEAFPWGDDPVSCEHAVIKDARGRSCGVRKHSGEAEVGRPLEVGSRPAGRYGLSDMIGNIEEWVYDWYSDDWDACGEPCLGVEPRGPCDGAEPCPGHAFKVVRGGSWYWDAPHGTAIHRRPHYPHNRFPKTFHHFGFRCAASVAEAGGPKPRDESH